MRILVAGGAGYLGTLLVRHLHDGGHECRVLDVNGASGLPADTGMMLGDIRDERAVERAVRGMDAIVNCVAMVPLAKDRRLFLAVNEQGTRTLLQAARNLEVPRFVQISSSAVYGRPEQLPVTEESPRLPQDPYGLSKKRAEDHCRAFAHEGMEVAILRPRTLLGAGRLGIFQVLFEWVRRGRRVPVLAGPESPYQFLHAADLAQAVTCVLEQRRPGEYNLGAGRYASIQEALQSLCVQAGTGASVVRLPRRPVEWGMQASHRLGISPLAPYHALMYGHAMYFDCGKAERELGWQPRWSNDEMLQESYRHYLQACAARKPSGTGSPHQQPLRSTLLEVFSRALELLPKPSR